MDSSEHASELGEESGLPPLPTLEPLPRLKPLAPMPKLPWDESAAGFPVPAASSAAMAAGAGPAAARPAAPPPPANHPAAEFAHAAAHPPVYAPPSTEHEFFPSVMTSPSPSPDPTADATGETGPDAAADSGAAPEPEATTAAAGAAPEPDVEPNDAAAEPGAAPESPAAEPDDAAATGVAADAMSWSHAVAAGVPFDSTFRGGLAQPDALGSYVSTGRHSSVQTARPDDQLPLAPGLKVLVIGGAEPLSGMVAERLISSGHRLAVHGVTIPAELALVGASAEMFRAFAPISLAGDRADTEEIVHTVAHAEVALGGLDALVILPAQRGTHIGLDADATTWADEWSMALTTEVLAAACATHIAARSFLARRKAGRIVLVTNGRNGASAGDQVGAMPASATRAALDRLGADLTRELSPHGIGVSVVTTGSGGTQDFAVAQVADVVEALLSTPVLSGVSAHIG